MEQHLQNK